MTATQIELNQVRREVYDYLFLDQAFTHEQAKSVSDGIKEVTGYYNGKPSRVRMIDGSIMYL